MDCPEPDLGGSSHTLSLGGFYRCPALQRYSTFLGAPLPRVQAGVATLCIPEGLSHPLVVVRVARNGLCVICSDVSASGQFSVTASCSPCDVEPESPRKTRRVHRWMRLTRVCDEHVRVPSPTIADQAIPDVAGAVIYDCRPRILPVSIRLKDIGHSPRVRPVASASVAAPPAEEAMVIGGASPERVAIPELGVAPPDDPGTDLEDELLQISPLPTIVSPLAEPAEALPVSPSLYPEPPVPGQPDPAPTLESRFIPLQEADERPTIDLFPLYLISPAQSYYDPVTSLVMLDAQDVSECQSPDSLATMDQYLAGDGDLLLGDSSELPLLSVLLLQIPVADVSVPESVATPSVGEFPVSSVVSSDLSREGPFDAGQTASGSGAAPHVLDSLPECQYHMTSYDTADRKEVEPAYGFQLHDPRFLEYVGVPESNRLLSWTPGYWLHHMNRNRAVSAALQLQHNAGIMGSVWDEINVPSRAIAHALWRL